MVSGSDNRFRPSRCKKVVLSQKEITIFLRSGSRMFTPLSKTFVAIKTLEEKELSFIISDQARASALFASKYETETFLESSFFKERPSFLLLTKISYFSDDVSAKIRS